MRRRKKRGGAKSGRIPTSGAKREANRAGPAGAGVGPAETPARAPELAAPSAAPSNSRVTAGGGPTPPPGAAPRVLRVGLDGRSRQGGFREDSGRGIGVYARELVRALAVRRDLALTLWFEPALPAVPAGMVPPGVSVRRYASTWLPLRDRLSSQFSVRAAAASRWWSAMAGCGP